MSLNPSNSSNLEQLALKGLIHQYVNTGIKHYEMGLIDCPK